MNLLDSCDRGGSRPSPSFGRSYLEENFEQLYTELFSKDQFQHYDHTGFDYEYSRYVEVEDSVFRTAVNNEFLNYKQGLQYLVGWLNNNSL